MTLKYICIIIVLVVFLIIYLRYDRSKIPKVIYQTYIDKTLIPDKVYINIKKYADGYQHIIYDDNECLEFIKKYYTKDVVDRFTKLKGPHRADLFRYCILYLKGGIYLDIKTHLIKPLDQIFNQRNTMYTVLARSRNKLYQGVIATPKYNPLFLDLIRFMVKIDLNYLKRSGTYHVFIIDMYNRINQRTRGRFLKEGFNKVRKGNINYILFKERCSKYSKDCYDGLDRYGFCCYIYRGMDKIIKTRYSDYPW